MERCITKYDFLLICLVMIFVFNLVGILANEDVQLLELVLGSVVTIAGFVAVKSNGTETICIGGK